MKYNIDKWSKSGVSGLVVLGSNGEYVYLTADEKVELVAKSREMLDEDKIIIAGTGCESAKETIDITNRCAEYSDYALILTPNYYKGSMTNEVLKNFFFRVAEASKIPVLLYNMPANSGINMSADLVIEISQHPNIVGIKDSSGNVPQISQIIHGTPDDFIVLAGSASFLFPALMMGAKGGVLALANVVPELCVKLYENYMSGNYDEARRIQMEILAPNMAVTAKFGVPGLKAAMNLAGYKGGNVRGPLLPANDAVKEQIKNIFAKIGVK